MIDEHQSREIFADEMYCAKWHQLVAPQQAMVERAFKAAQSLERARAEELVRASEDINITLKAIAREALAKHRSGK